MLQNQLGSSGISNCTVILKIVGMTFLTVVIIVNIAQVRIDGWVLQPICSFKNEGYPLGHCLDSIPGRNYRINGLFAVTLNSSSKAR